jgi:uncharacterized membrane protein
MSNRRDTKIYTLRHWLFYAGVIVILGITIGVAHSVMEWSDGLTFAVALVAGTIACMMALREDLLAPPRHSRERHNNRA